MSVSLAINVRDNATAAIEALIASVQPKRLAAIIREPCVRFWRDRLKSDIYQHSASGTTGSKREAWARSVVGEATEDGVTLSAGDGKAAIGLRQRYRGGPIGPGPKALSIPIAPESYGKSPGDFTGLERTIRKVAGELRVYLVIRTYRTGPRGGKIVNSERFLFRLKREVMQGGNPLMIPSNDEFAEVCMARITESLSTT
jgi:hypothetical protein